jgi:hypothetical protein
MPVDRLFGNAQFLSDLVHGHRFQAVALEELQTTADQGVFLGIHLKNGGKITWETFVPQIVSSQTSRKRFSISCSKS